jgi:tetratricopeptide (TPR) repeat protein
MEYLSEEEAQARFLLVAQRKRGADWRPPEAERRSLGHILDLTERHALAVELAAARVDTLTLQEIASGIASQTPSLIFEVRQPGSLTIPGILPPAVTRCLEWTHSLLPPELQDALTRLSVFAGSLTIQSATPICDLTDAARILYRLQDVGLLSGFQSHGLQRYVMPSPVRMYTMPRFSQHSDAIPIKKRFVLFYRHLAQHQGEAITLQDTERLELLDSEWANIQMAAEYAREHAGWDSVWEIADSCDAYLTLRNAAEFQKRLYRIAWEMLPEDQAPPESALIAHRLSCALERLGEMDEAETFAGQAEERCRESGNCALECSLLLHWGTILTRQKKWTEAEERFYRCLTLAEKRKDQEMQAHALQQIGDLFRRQHLWEAAAKSYEECARLRGLLDDETGREAIALPLGKVYMRLARWEEAGQIYREQQAAAHRNGNRVEEGCAWNNLGIALLQQGQTQEAMRCFGASLALKRELQDADGEAETLLNLGLAHQAQENWTDAETCYRECLEWARAHRKTSLESSALNNLGIIFQQQKRYAEAEDIFRNSMALAQARGDVRAEGQTLANFGALCYMLQRWREAEECYQRSLRFCRDSGDRSGEAKMLENLALLYAAQNRFEEAVRFEQQALAVWAKMADPVVADRARRHLALWQERLSGQRT